MTSIQSESIRKYLRKDVLNEDTGELIDSNKVKALLDENKKKAETELMGYYMIITSEINMSDQDVVDTYHKLSLLLKEYSYNQVSNMTGISVSTIYRAALKNKENLKTYTI